MSKRKLEKEIKIDRVDSQSSPEQDGFFPLQVLSEKYGYAKDYIGWLARTSRIQAIRYGKYGQWYASEVSLNEYRQSLTISNQERFNANKAKLKAILASAEVIGLKTGGNKDNIIQGEETKKAPSLSVENASPVLLPPVLLRNTSPRAA